MTSDQDKKQQHQQSSIQLEDLKEGMKVRYHPIGGGSENTSESTGIVKRVITHDETVGSSPHHVAASDKEPRILIENERTKKETPYKLSNIVEIVNE